MRTLQVSHVRRIASAARLAPIIRLDTSCEFRPRNGCSERERYTSGSPATSDGNTSVVGARPQSSYKGTHGERRTLAAVGKQQRLREARTGGASDGAGPRAWQLPG